MAISIFTPPEVGKEWQKCKAGDICDCISYEYEKFFNGVGTFTMELPISTRFRDKLEVGSILVTDSGDAFIVKNIKTTLDKITLTGYDLNGLLCDRITLYSGEVAGTDGTDPFSGSTEACVKHYVSFNMVDCPDEKRILPRFGVAENTLDRGIADDHALPRLQNLQELVTEICGGAGLGWRVSISDNTSGTTQPVFVFDVAEQVDRSANQSDRSTVVFSEKLHNVEGITREVGVTASRNAVYLDFDGTVIQYPQQGDKSGREVGTGYSRREEYCQMSGKSLDPDVYCVEAEQHIADRMEATDSLTVEAGNPLDYGVMYDVGTIVSVYDSENKLQLDSVISAATVRRSGSEYSVRLTLGESKPKLLDQYQKKSSVTQRTVRNESGTVSGNYVTGIKFLTGGFDLTFQTPGGANTNKFTIAEDGAGNITKITNKTAGRSIDVTYE
mgnify:CR=1 FL=1